MSPRAPSMRILALTACASVALLFVSVSEAATPVKNGVYEGPAKGSESRSDHRIVRIKVSGDGKTLNFRGPHERCGGFNPLSAFFPRIEKVKISKTGKFEGKRVYTDTSRGPNYVLDWTVKVTGSFTNSNTAKGTVVYEMAHQGRSPQRQRCGKRTVTWTAKRT
jgi:hypothetical protein